MNEAVYSIYSILTTFSFSPGPQCYVICCVTVPNFFKGRGGGTPPPQKKKHGTFVFSVPTIHDESRLKSHTHGHMQNHTRVTQTMCSGDTRLGLVTADKYSWPCLHTTLSHLFCKHTLRKTHTRTHNTLPAWRCSLGTQCRQNVGRSRDRSRDIRQTEANAFQLKGLTSVPIHSPLSHLLSQHFLIARPQH